MKRSRSSTSRAPAVGPSTPAGPVDPQWSTRTGLLLFGAALAIRVLHVWQIGRAPFFDVLMGDARAYDEWAQRLAGGDWIGSDVFYQAPLYPYFLGVLYSLLGRDLLLVRLCQAAIGAGSCVLLGAAGARMFSARVGVVAGSLLALYPPAIFFDGLIQKSVLDVFFIALALWLVARLLDAPARLADWLGLGLAMGGLSLTRENALVFVAAIGLWLGIGLALTLADRARAAAAFALGLALVLVPVALRNYTVGGGFYLTTAQLGPNLYIGNNPRADGTYMSLRYGRGAPEYERIDATELAEQAAGRTLTPGEVSSFWTGRAVDFITGRPGDWLALMARKLALVWNADEMLDTESQETYAEWSWLLAVGGPIGHFGVLVPLAALGLAVSWPRRSRVWVLYAMIAAYAASVVAFYVFARYRFPLVPLLILLAAAGLADARTLASRWPPGRRAVGAVVLIALVVFTNWPLLSADQMRAITETNLGTAMQERGDLAAAARHYMRAIELQPGHAPAYNNLGTVQRAQGDVVGALASYERALALVPDYPTVHFNLANALLASGKPAEAVPHFQRALETNPSVEVISNLGIALDAQGQHAEAIGHFRKALELAPKEPMSYRNLANALVGSGAAGEAMALLRQGVAVAPTDPDVHYDLAGLLLERQEFNEAVTVLQTALTLRPNWPDAYNNLGIALGSQGRIGEAIAAFERAVALNPAFEDARGNLAMARRAQQAGGPRRP